jgi:hypothetical protein
MGPQASAGCGLRNPLRYIGRTAGLRLSSRCFAARARCGLPAGIWMNPTRQRRE